MPRRLLSIRGSRFAATLIGDAMRHMPGRHMARRRFTVPGLIVEEHIGREGFEKGAFIEPAQKQALINTDAPCTQGTHHPFMRRR